MLATNPAPGPSTITDVLLVDTDIVTAIYGPVLREKYRVHTASTSEAALQQLTRNQPALVILDLGAAGISGVDLCRRAKTLLVPSTVLITTTEVARVPDALEAGCDGVLLKPFAPNLLHARIGRLLRSRLADSRLSTPARHARSGNGNRLPTPWTSGTNRAWPHTPCPSCNGEGAVSFEFSSHRRWWYACLKCRQVWIGRRQE